MGEALSIMHVRNFSRPTAGKKSLLDVLDPEGLTSGTELL